jgi:hypothetical protein
MKGKTLRQMNTEMMELKAERDALAARVMEAEKKSLTFDIAETIYTEVLARFIADDRLYNTYKIAAKAFEAAEEFLSVADNMGNK